MKTQTIKKLSEVNKWFIEYILTYYQGKVLGYEIVGQKY